MLTVGDLLSSVFVRSGETLDSLRRDRALPLKYSILKPCVASLHKRTGENGLIYVVPAWRGKIRVLMLSRNPIKSPGKVSYTILSALFKQSRTDDLSSLHCCVGSAV